MRTVTRSINLEGTETTEIGLKSLGEEGRGIFQIGFIKAIFN